MPLMTASKPTVIIGLMTTYAALLDHNMSHTWMLFPFGWSRHGDWPDIAASRAPLPLLVQYDMQDDLFTEDGMREAHMRIAKSLCQCWKARCLYRKVLSRTAQI